MTTPEGEPKGIRAEPSGSATGCSSATAAGGFVGPVHSATTTATRSGTQRAAPWTSTTSAGRSCAGHARTGHISAPACNRSGNGRPAFGELLDDYLRRKDLRARDEAEKKLRRRKEAARVELLRTSLGHLPVSAITTRDVETLYEDLKARQVGEGDEARPLAVATVNRYMKLLHAVLRFGVRRGLLLTNPAASVELARENNARNRCLSTDEEARSDEGPACVDASARRRGDPHRHETRGVARLAVGGRRP